MFIGVGYVCVSEPRRSFLDGLTNVGHEVPHSSFVSF
jgi:hypothetical protein